METFFAITSILGCIVLFGFTVICVYCAVNYLRYISFQRKLKTGNKCKFYQGQQLYYGTISSFIDDIVIVVDTDGYPNCLYRSEVYPL